MSAEEEAGSLKRKRDDPLSLLTSSLTDPSWRAVLQPVFDTPAFYSLSSKIQTEREQNNIFPSEENLWSAFNLCPLDKVRMVIIGQDPYAQKGQANGLSFSIPSTCLERPPSLVNLLNELQRSCPDTNIPPAPFGDLSHWARKKGILMLNSSLTVMENIYGSHAKHGWEHVLIPALKAVIETAKQKQARLGLKRIPLVIMALGRPAQNLVTKAIPFAFRGQLMLLKTSHPSPKSADYGFNGCDHFHTAREYLRLYSDTKDTKAFNFDLVEGDEFVQKKSPLQDKVEQLEFAATEGRRHYKRGNCTPQQFLEILTGLDAAVQLLKEHTQ